MRAQGGKEAGETAGRAHALEDAQEDVEGEQCNPSEREAHHAARTECGVERLLPGGQKRVGGDGVGKAAWRTPGRGDAVLD